MRQSLLFAPVDVDGRHPGEIGFVEKAFARHETFHPRYGWLKKAFDAAVADPEIFLRDDAPVILGVGKNMVRAIRYWATAFKVLYEYPNLDRPRASNVKPSGLGLTLLDRDGWDPYLEHPGSLWLMHWQLLRPISSAPSWYYAFNLFKGVDFTDQDLVEELKIFRDAHPDWGRVVDRSLKRDVDCLIRMYAAGADRMRFTEDSIDSPFVELGLLAPTAGDRHHVRFNLGPKDSLPDAVVAYACLDYLGFAGHQASTVSLRRLANDVGSPGRAFKITESVLRKQLESQALRDDRLDVTDPAGIGQLVVHEDPEQLAAEALRDMYRGPSR